MKSEELCLTHGGGLKLHIFHHLENISITLLKQTIEKSI